MARFKRKIKSKLRAIANDNEKLRPFIRWFMETYGLIRYKQLTFWRRVDPKVVVFASFGGESYSDNPKALFEYMMRSGQFEGYTFIWGFKKDLAGKRRTMRRLKKSIVDEILIAEGLLDPDSGTAVEMVSEWDDDVDENSAGRPAEAAAAGSSAADSAAVLGTAAVNSGPAGDVSESRDATTGGVGELSPAQLRLQTRRTELMQQLPDVSVVTYGGDSWRKALGRAGYWIFNFKVDDYLKPRRKQVFLQTWHGTPLKRLGYDLEHFDNKINTMAEMKKRYGVEVRKFSYFISPSAFSSDRFRSAWRMEDFGKSDIILEEGYPRNDILFNYTEEQVEKIKNRIFGYYFLPYTREVHQKKIVLYAPTYRANQHENGVGYTYQTEIDFDRLQSELGDDFVILFRAHYLVASKFNFSRYGGFIYNASKVNDINDLYLISDLMVTDYSSSMFDYANLKRPMIFYMYDLEHYRDESNGFYFDPEEELPGPIVRTEDELIDAIRRAVPEFNYDEKYRRFNEKFDPLDDGHASERVVKKVFGK